MLLNRPLCVLSILAFTAIGLTGCASSGPSESEKQAAMEPKEPPVNLRAGVPASAQEKARGKGSLSYEATGDGIVYLYDLNNNSVVGQYHVQRGQTLLVSGQSGRATLAGNEVQTVETLSPTRTYITYLLPLDGSNDAAGTSNNNRGQRYDLRVVPSEQNSDN